MRLLIDTHVLLWHLDDAPQLPTKWNVVLEDSAYEKWFSIVSLWEIATKINIGRLTVRYLLDRLLPADFHVLPVDIAHVLAYQQLPVHHRDPFERMLIAQSQTERLTMMTQDASFPLYDVSLYTAS